MILEEQNGYSSCCAKLFQEPTSKKSSYLNLFFLYSSEKNLLLFYTQPDFEFCAHCETVNGGRRVSYMYTCKKKKKKKNSAYFTSQFMTYEASDENVCQFSLIYPLYRSHHKNVITRQVLHTLCFKTFLVSKNVLKTPKVFFDFFKKLELKKNPKTWNKNKF